MVRKIVAKYVAARADVHPDEIAWRLMLPMLIEAVRILDEQAASAGEVDTAMLFGLKFFEQHGGVLSWADTVGLPTILTRLRELKRFGERFVPPVSLLQMVQSGLQFHDAPQRRAA